jgi:hypothetical protein
LQTKHKKLLRLQVTTKSKSHSSSTKYSWTPVSGSSALPGTRHFPFEKRSRCRILAA